MLNRVNRTNAVIIAALSLATAMIGGCATGAESQKGSQIGRYQFRVSTPPGVIYILDTTTGKVTTQSG